MKLYSQNMKHYFTFSEYSVILIGDFNQLMRNDFSAFASKLFLNVMYNLLLTFFVAYLLVLLHLKSEAFNARKIMFFSKTWTKTITSIT